MKGLLERQASLQRKPGKGLLAERLTEDYQKERARRRSGKGMKSMNTMTSKSNRRNGARRKGQLKVRQLLRGNPKAVGGNLASRANTALARSAKEK